MAPQTERDFPLGHPAAVDTVIGSAEHKAWLRAHEFLENKRDFPPGHPKAADTPGNQNHVPVVAGVDPLNAHLEPFTGYTPQKAAAIAEHPRAREIVWVQEEPANMGALFFVLPRLKRLAQGLPVRSLKRSASASPSTGSAKAHALEQKTLLQLAFTTQGAE